MSLSQLASAQSQPSERSYRGRPRFNPPQPNASQRISYPFNPVPQALQHPDMVKNLLYSDQAVAQAVCTLLNVEGRPSDGAVMTINRVARWAGSCPRTVSRCIPRLVKAGILIMQKEPSRSWGKFERWLYRWRMPMMEAPHDSLSRQDGGHVEEESKERNASQQSTPYVPPTSERDDESVPSAIKHAPAVEMPAPKSKAEAVSAPEPQAAERGVPRVPGGGAGPAPARPNAQLEALAERLRQLGMWTHGVNRVLSLRTADEIEQSLGLLAEQSELVNPAGWLYGHLVHHWDEIQKHHSEPVQRHAYVLPAERDSARREADLRALREREALAAQFDHARLAEQTARAVEGALGRLSPEKRAELRARALAGFRGKTFPEGVVVGQMLVLLENDRRDQE